MADKAKIHAGLKKMDPKNDNHWTMQGEAKLDTVKFLSGGEVVTREELGEIAPGFNREEMAKYVAEQEKHNGGQVAPPAPPALGSGTRPAIESKQPEMELGSRNREAEIEELAETIRDTDEEILKCQRVHEEMKARIVMLQAFREKADLALSKLQPKMTHQASIQAYLASNKKIMQARGDARHHVVKSGLDLGLLQEALSPSPIDQLMQSRPRRR